MIVPEELIASHARILGVHPEILACFVAIESGFHPSVVRYEPNWKYSLTPDLFSRKLGISARTEFELQKFSWGLLQIMGTVAREVGFDGHLTELCYPDVGLQIGGLKVLQVLQKFGASTDAVASYNGGSPFKSPDGLYLNQEYVDRFLSEWTHRGGRCENGTLIL